jgi:glycosyltransferase involved in cell wall biosynthesis
MKVLYISQHFATPDGTAGIRPYQMARQLLADGHDVTLVCGSFRGANLAFTQPFINGVRRGFVDGIEVIQFDLPYSNSDGLIKRTVAFFKYTVRATIISLTENYDLVFATTTPLTAGIPGVMARWIRRKLFVFEVRDLWPELPRAMGVIRNPFLLWSMSLLEWVSYRSAHRLIGLSPGIAEGIRRRGVSKSRIAMIPNGCDVEIFAIEGLGWRPAAIQSQDFLAVFAGTHGMANGLDAVLDAAAELKRRGRNDIKILLIGDGKLKPGLQLRVSRERLTNVVFHDPVNKAKLAELMASADLGLQILANIPEFYYGTSPNKFFDYLAAGLPVLNNYPGWLADIITESGCGFTVPPDDPVAFVDALEMAADSRQSLSVMGDCARKLGQNRFNRRVLSRQWVDWVVGVRR